QISVPPELALPGGRTYQLDRAAPGVFRHVEGAGRVVEFSLKSATSASLLITGSGGDGRRTWQLTRSCALHAGPERRTPPVPTPSPRPRGPPRSSGRTILGSPGPGLGVHSQ